MPRRPVVTPLGCPTDEWLVDIDISQSVRCMLEDDPSLRQVLYRAFQRHAQRLPKLMHRGDLVQTEAWKQRRPRLSVFVTTHCSASAHLTSLVHLMKFDPPGARRRRP